MDESTQFLRQRLIDPELCARCNSCEEACKRAAISHDSASYAVDPARCDGCNDCMSACSTGAIDSWRLVDRSAPYSIEAQLSWLHLPEPLPGLPGPAAMSAMPNSATWGHRPRAPATAVQPVSHRYDREHPAAALIRESRILTRSVDGAEVRHIVLGFPDVEFAVLEGQSIGVVPPGRDDLGRDHHVRLYSVASARDGEVPGRFDIALTVKRVMQDHDGHPVRGVCSNFLCDLPIGSRLQVTGPVGETFLMPDEPGAPLLMICTGTGIAPMRAMIRRRMCLGDARREDLMLLYGGRTPEELPYREELEGIGAERLDLGIGYSRIPGAPKRYVQDLLRVRRADVARLILERQATIYLCGLRAMESDVKQALAEALGIAESEWDSYSQRLSSSGRYHVEVY